MSSLRHHLFRGEQIPGMVENEEGYNIRLAYQSPYGKVYA